MNNSGQGLAYYEALVLKIKQQILAGVYDPNDKLPSVRELAVAESLNPNTVAKAYKQLEQDGVLYVQPGKGSFVSPPQDETAAQTQKMAAKFNQLLVEAHIAGVSKRQILDWVETEYKEMGK
ncbi:GntR family transcriptional regulator [Lacticaseibacillus saniviri]|uniref:HTH gntR-type domain-containing protein n=1 Tax=Lacticaseibacillus saniviri JCM 17471 = DSM 24301 TaxID=1293598 RepID=A0A0R2MRS9_9LACO|nr:GntR family transcriptional regulator [Lacticaseibacillus saniviri]KRO16296.1 hypothetical protein IV56_GL001657 [Lacticaseibacillus saniviri JCM 17471 = DSM 24301]MCG4281863.1 GntR family transcriptional regulator [Lacticaseibacillus saniviri]